MKSFCFILFLPALYGMAAHLTREYVYISTTMSWPEAQSYCRQNCMDLATITTINEKTKSYGCYWIGLEWLLLDWSEQNRTRLGHMANVWWRTDDLLGDKKCVVLFFRWMEWYALFKWVRSLILVKEMKTQEEALHYCRNTTLTCCAWFLMHSYTWLNQRPHKPRQSVYGLGCASWMENGSGWTSGQWSHSAMESLHFISIIIILELG